MLKVDWDVEVAEGLEATSSREGRELCMNATAAL